MGHPCLDPRAMYLPLLAHQYHQVLSEKALGSRLGTSIAPREDDTDAIKRKWKIRSDKAYSLIALSLDAPLQIHLVGTTNAKEAWEIIEKQYSFVSITQLVRLTRKFYTASMQEGEDIMEHITRMSRLAQELRDYAREMETKLCVTYKLS